MLILGQRAGADEIVFTLSKNTILNFRTKSHLAGTKWGIAMAKQAQEMELVSANCTETINIFGYSVISFFWALDWSSVNYNRVNVNQFSSLENT